MPPGNQSRLVTKAAGFARSCLTCRSIAQINIQVVIEMAGLQIVNGVVIAAAVAIFAGLVYGTWALFKERGFRPPGHELLVAGRFLPARLIPGPFPLTSVTPAERPAPPLRCDG
jgi:hypothetical protein